MTRNRTAVPPRSAGDAIERLIEAVEKLAGEMQCLRSTVDRLQDDFAWALNNDVFRRPEFGGDPVPVMPITSMPFDPLASDWAKRINRLGPDDLPHEEEPPRENSPSTHKDMFTRREPKHG
jgi:hypothetical protein